MPAPANPNASAFRKIFCHPTAPDAHGYPVKVSSYYPVTAKRQRQRYVFEIVYADGSIHVFNLPCISCPYELSRDHVLSILFSFKRQSMKEDSAEKMIVVYDKICQTLRNRNDDVFIEAHTMFFNGLPKSDEENHSSYYNSLLYLFEKYGGDIKFSVRTSILDGPMVVEDGIGPITFKGSLVTRQERRTLLEADGTYVPLSKRKGKVAADKKPAPKMPTSKKQSDEESDCDNCSLSENDSDSESSTSTGSEDSILFFSRHIYNIVFVISLISLIVLIIRI